MNSECLHTYKKAQITVRPNITLTYKVLTLSYSFNLSIRIIFRLVLKMLESPLLFKWITGVSPSTFTSLHFSAFWNLLVTTSNYGNAGVIGSVSCCLVIFSSLLLSF